MTVSPQKRVRVTIHAALYAATLTTILTAMDLDRFKTLYDILLSCIPTPPEADANLNKTKETTKSEVAVSALDQIVYCPEIFDRLLKEGQRLTECVEFDPNNMDHMFFAAYAIPGIATSLYPKDFHSESSVVWWSTFTILWPALAALRSVMTDNKEVCFDDRRQPPFISSGAALKIIPDSVP